MISNLYAKRLFVIRITKRRFLLSGQVSNLNSSGPKPDVLPITPPDNLNQLLLIGGAKIINILNQQNFYFNLVYF